MRKEEGEKKKKGNMGSKEGSPTYLITKAPSATGTRTSIPKEIKVGTRA